MEAESTNKRNRGPLIGSLRAGLGWLWHLLVDHGPEPRRALTVIAWWELRRPVFNVAVLAGGSLTILLWALTIKSWISILPPPFFFFLGVILFFVLANICYTIGWGVELVLRSLTDPTGSFVSKFGKRAFVAGTLFSFGLTALPGLSALVMYLAGHPVTTPQSNYTTVLPSESDLVGRYDADAPSMSRIERAGFDPTEPYHIELYADSTCRLTNFPTGFHPEFGEVQRVFTCDGIWRVTKDDWEPQEYCYVTIYSNCGELPPPGMRYGHSWRFHLRNEEPPYELFEWVSDPDSWEYLVFRQRPEADSVLILSRTE